MIDNSNTAIDLKKQEEEIARFEQQQYEKEKKREYYKEKDRKTDERLDRLEKTLTQMSCLFKEVIDLKQQEVANNKKQQSIDVDNEFEAQIRQMQNERHYREQQKLYDINYVGDLEYSLFCAWCNGYRSITIPGSDGKLDMERMQAESYVNPKFFKEYCEQEYPKGFKQKISDDRIKRYIGEKYFGYEYYTDENGKLRAKKKSQ